MELLDGRYQIKEVLGKGGFGTTFLAEDKRNRTHPICVVKQLQPNFSELYLLTKSLDLFDREAETLEILGKHPNIPTLFAYFEENNDFYIVQEYIAGHTLTRELIPNQPLSERQVINIVKELLEILQFVHKYNVIHRDIKPANIIRRTQDNKLVLIDFGSVKKVTLTGANKGTIVGSYAYLPEEQFNGQPNFCSDLYAVGMIGIQAITGRELKDILGAGFPLNERGEISWQNYAEVSNELANFLSRMVRRNYRERYQSAEEALQALQNVVEKKQVLAHNNRAKSHKLLFLPFKTIIWGGIVTGVISFILITYNMALKQQSFLQLPLNEKPVTRFLNSKDICQDFDNNFYCEKYLFSGKKGQTVIIEMLSKDFAPYLLVVKKDNKKLAFNDDSSIYSWDARISVTLPEDGKYIAIAKNSKAGESGKYTLRATIKKF